MIRHFKKLMYECFPDPADRQSIDTADKAIDFSGIFECSDKRILFNKEEDLTEPESKMIENAIKIASVKYRDPRSRPQGWSAYKCIEDTILKESYEWLDIDFVLMEERAYHREGTYIVPSDSSRTYIVQNLKPLQKMAYQDYKRKYQLTTLDAIDKFRHQLSKDSQTMHTYTKIK